MKTGGEKAEALTALSAEAKQIGEHILAVVLELVAMAPLDSAVTCIDYEQRLRDLAKIAQPAAAEILKRAIAILRG